MSKNGDSFLNINVPMALIFLILPIAAGYYLAALFSVSEPNNIYTVIERCNIIIDKPFAWYFNLFTIPAILFMILLYTMFTRLIFVRYNCKIFVLFNKYRNATILINFSVKIFRQLNRKII